MKKIILFAVFLIFLSNSAQLFAQKEPEDITSETDKFQEFFYNSLLQKSIENHDKAIESLEQCLQLKPNNATVFFEMGKNYYGLKDYTSAYNYYEKATKIEPKNRWFWAGMYDVCYDTKDYNKAIVVVQKLIEFKEEYKEDLVGLYIKTQQFDKALGLINELNDKVGKSAIRDAYKAQITQGKKQQIPEKSNVSDENKTSPNDDLKTQLQLFQTYTNLLQFDKLAIESQKMIELYPTEPQLYYYAGLANNQLKNYKKAKTFLETGIDYVVENRILEINFNIQLGETYNGLGDKSKKEMYFIKANSLLKLEKK